MPAGDPPRSVPFVNFPAQYAEEREDILACVEETFRQGMFVGGNAIEALEGALAEYCGVGNAVCLNSGTDALILALKALEIGPGDEVITPPNSFIASTAAIVAAGAQPVFVDVRDDQNIEPTAIEAAITPRTKVIMPVHLTGRIADMTPIMRIAERHGMAVIEDAAQAFGSRYDGRLSGAIGTVGCFSAHPLKNLNAAGDAGFITTNDDRVSDRVRASRNHGLVDRDTARQWGTVSRLDTLQAAILLMRLGKIETVIERRRKNVDLYRSLLDPGAVFVPPCHAGEFNTFHTFAVQADRRDALQVFLDQRGIGSAVHYPVPIHLQPAARGLGYVKGDFPVAERQAKRVLSLPVHQFLCREDIAYAATVINQFFA